MFVNSKNFHIPRSLILESEKLLNSFQVSSDIYRKFVKKMNFLKLQSDTTFNIKIM